MADFELSIGQCMPWSFSSNQITARTLRYFAGIVLRVSLIQFAFEPPRSSEAVSPITIGLFGAILATRL